MSYLLQTSKRLRLLQSEAQTIRPDAVQPSLGVLQSSVPRGLFKSHEKTQQLLGGWSD